MKMKNMKLKAVLLSLVAVLTLGLTSCTDETSGDQTTGQPGYLTLNLKTLKPKQTKTANDLTNDYQTIKNLNVFIFRGENLILRKYITTQNDGVTPLANTTNTVDIRVGELQSTDSVVVVANYPTGAIDISTKSALQDIVIPTVGDFSTTGLCMTGVGSVVVGTGFTYSSAVKIAPVVSKISVKWLTSGDAAYYGITGIYIVNAIDHTKLPLVLGWNGVNRAITSLISPSSKTASSGFAVANTAAARDYDIYAHSVISTAGILSDVSAAGDSLRFASTYSYYVGENYHADLPTTRNGGSLFANAAANNAANANTIILIEATPKTGAPAWIGTAKKYYTYDLNKNIAAIGGTFTSPNAPITGVVDNGFSTKRKTNYVVTFNLTSIGTTNPFERSSILSVTVTATPWDNEPSGVTF